jgi:site-specific DNA recombinase
MSSQAQLQGRYLGGRPPYGYRITDAGPHPNPSKAAAGQRIHKLEPDPVAAPIVQRIFTMYVDGMSDKAIAAQLTRDGIPCPSAHDATPNPHRKKTAWQRGAVRAILINPRYTGYEVWNKQRKEERLLDIDDVTLGHTTSMTHNPTEEWIRSNKPAHEAIISPNRFVTVQTLRKQRARNQGGQERAGKQGGRPYALRGRVRCTLCGCNPPPSATTSTTAANSKTRKPPSTPTSPTPSPSTYAKTSSAGPWTSGSPAPSPPTGSPPPSKHSPTPAAAANTAETHTPEQAQARVYQDSGVIRLFGL